MILELDEDGYPTDETCESISTHKYDGSTSFLEDVLSLWYYPKYWEVIIDINGDSHYSVSTGGWSGNESLIHALQSNQIFWLICWRQSTRGGHYHFVIKGR